MRNLYHIHVTDQLAHSLVNMFSKMSCINEIDMFLHTFQAEVKLEDLLNLSILISKGKEIN